jgi:hypothetical protein
MVAKKLEERTGVKQDSRKHNVAAVFLILFAEL